MATGHVRAAVAPSSPGSASRHSDKPLPCEPLAVRPHGSGRRVPHRRARKVARWMLEGRQLDMIEWLDTHQVGIPRHGIEWVGGSGIE